ncbi:hypothetical protein HY468_02115 [Candidatus Roizmanbacteria bacterium]|nr:hypothetical protein [Candidatus Roizmanbacteria bacterium]
MERIQAVREYLFQKILALRSLPRKQLYSLIAITVLVIGLGALVIAVRQRQNIAKQAAGAGDGQLVCDAGTDPYASTTISVTNNTTQEVPVDSRVFRCTYKPNRIQKGYYYCDSNCNPATNPNCDVGVWDQAASEIDVHIQPGETRTFSMTVNPCEIAQIDVENVAVHVSDDPTECYNVRSQYTNPPPPNRWPGGISFGIADNPQGYNAATGTCPQPTATPTSIVPSATPQPTATPTLPPGVTPSATPVPSATPQPTAPPGQPTYTPAPTATPIPTQPPQPTQPPVIYPTNTPLPTRPVAGNPAVTAIGILGGIGLLILSIL